MSHIRFVYTEPNALGIEYLSAVLKRAGHTVGLVLDLHNIYGFKLVFARNIFRYGEKLIKRILKDKPDIVAFSVTSNNIEWAYSVAEEIKRHSCMPIVFGGIQATLIPEAVIAKKFVDFVAIGEGEFALLDLVNSLQNNDSDYSIKNIWFKKDGEVIRNPLRNLIDNLDILPFPDKELFSEISTFNRCYSTITARGCPCVCTFCCSPVMREVYKDKGKAFRRRSPENVIAELKRAKDKYNINRVIFEDDLFTYDKQWMRSFSEFYRKEISLPFLIRTSPSFIDDEMIYLLKNMNCRIVEIGVQTLNEKIREKVLRRYYSNARIKSLLDLLKKNNISCRCDNIVGLPGEKEEDILEMIKFYNEVRSGKIDIYYLKYYPKTEIAKMSGLDKNILEDINTGRIFASPLYEVGHNLGKLDFKKINRLILMAALIYIFPRKVIDYMIKRRLYRFLPYIKNCYSINDFMFYISSFFRNKCRNPAYISLRNDTPNKIIHKIKDIFHFN